MNAVRSSDYDRGFRDGAQSNVELAEHVAEHGLAVIDGIFKPSPARAAAAEHFRDVYKAVRKEWGRCPGNDMRVKTARLLWLSAVVRDLWRAPK